MQYGMQKGFFNPPSVPVRVRNRAGGRRAGQLGPEKADSEVVDVSVRVRACAGDATEEAIFERGERRNVGRCY